MKRFDTLQELIENMGFESYRQYIKDEIMNYLNCVGSDIVNHKDEEPKGAFNVEIEGKKYQIGITSIELEDGNWRDYCWITDNLKDEYLEEKDDDDDDDDDDMDWKSFYKDCFLNE